jgi:site-specific recombinase XerD
MGSSLTELVDSFALHLRAANLSPRTARSYADAVNGLSAFLTKAGVSTDVRNLRRRDIEAYIADQLDRCEAVP